MTRTRISIPSPDDEPAADLPDDLPPSLLKAMLEGELETELEALDGPEVDEGRLVQGGTEDNRRSKRFHR